MNNKELSLSINEYNQLELPINIEGIPIEKSKNVEPRLILYFPSLDLSIMIIGELNDENNKLMFPIPIIPINNVEDNVTEANIEIIIDNVYYPICKNIPFMVRQPKITMSGNITINAVEDEIKNKVKEEDYDDEEKNMGLEDDDKPTLNVDNTSNNIINDDDDENNRKENQKEIKSTPIKNDDTNDWDDDDWSDDVKIEDEKNWRNKNKKNN